MKTEFKTADRAESIILSCRELYLKYGYRRFSMSKFEDYDFYAVNKSFLTSNSILTFTDKKGKLKALKPDVTLSIVKNICVDELPAKLFYNENVYRPDESGNEFREIMQLGLESIGPCDLYSTAEVIMLAEKSLCEISDDHILDISHMGILHSMLEASGLENEKHGALIDAISRRSTDAVRSLIKDTEIADKICRLVSEYAPATQLIGLLEEILPESPAVTELKGVVSVLSALSLDKKIYLDFSLVNDISYYNGIIFKGFISGIPSAVLSGGRYDPLITRFGMNCGACGFAIYLDRISGYEGSAIAKEADVLVLYGDSVAPEKLALTLDELVKSGKTVKAASASCAPDASLFGEIVTLSE